MDNDNVEAIPYIDVYRSALRYYIHLQNILPDPFDPQVLELIDEMDKLWLELSDDERNCVENEFGIKENVEVSK